MFRLIFQNGVKYELIYILVMLSLVAKKKVRVTIIPWEYVKAKTVYTKITKSRVRTFTADNNVTAC